jgi:hypothetical protein
MINRSPVLALRLLQVLSIRLRALNSHFVSEISRRMEHTQAEVQNLHQLIEAAKSLNSTLDLEQLLDVILETALHIVDGDRGTVYVLQEEKRRSGPKLPAD